MTAFDIDTALEQVAAAVAPYPPAAMFQLAQEGYDSLFEQLVSCIISIRTYDEVSVPVSHRLFTLGRTPTEIAQLPVEKILQAIQRSTFAERKAEQIHAIAEQICTDYDGQLPANPAVLTGFNGVGPKCANLALGVATGYPCISVDVHVHRVTNRWGYVQAKTPEKTLAALEQVLPRRHWIDINRLLVPFGKHICGQTPRCRRCPLTDMCPSAHV